MRRSTWTRRTPRGSSPTACRPTNTTTCRATRTDPLRDRLPLSDVEDCGGQLLQDREQEFLPHDHILPRPQLLRRRDLHPQMRYLRFQSLFQRPDFHVGQQEFHGAPPFRSIPLIAPSAVCLSRAPCWRGASGLSVRQHICETAHWAVPGGSVIIPITPKGGNAARSSPFLRQVPDGYGNFGKLTGRTGRGIPMRWHRPDKKRFFVFLAVLGPGIITASVDNDAGGIATYSIAGAHFGYSLLWTLIPITAALIVVQEMVARMGVVTGKTLADLIREKFGVRPTFFLLIALLLANISNTVAE